MITILCTKYVDNINCCPYQKLIILLNSDDILSSMMTCQENINKTIINDYNVGHKIHNIIHKQCILVFVLQMSVPLTSCQIGLKAQSDPKDLFSISGLEYLNNMNIIDQNFPQIPQNIKFGFSVQTGENEPKHLGLGQKQA